MKIRTAFLTVAAFGLAACTPAAQEPAPATPDPAPIADAAPAPSGPAAENTPDSLASGPTADPAAPAPVASTPPAAAATVDYSAGRAVYEGAGSCKLCHGPTGQGTPMGVALTAGLDYASIKEKVVKGAVKAGDTMPPMGAALSAEQLDALAKFVEAGLPQ